MSRSAKIAGVAALVGMMMAIAVVGMTSMSMKAPVLPAGAQPVLAAPDPLGQELDRCSTLTMPDSGCEAVWAENRRRFLDDSRPEDSTTAAPENGSARP